MIIAIPLDPTPVFGWAGSDSRTKYKDVWWCSDSGHHTAPEFGRVKHLAPSGAFSIVVGASIGEDINFQAPYYWLIDTDKISTDFLAPAVCARAKKPREILKKLLQGSGPDNWKVEQALLFIEEADGDSPLEIEEHLEPNSRIERLKKIKEEKNGT